MQAHLLHRHGARYPTTDAGPAVLAKRLAAAKTLRATGDLSFLNSWTCSARSSSPSRTPLRSCTCRSARRRDPYAFRTRAVVCTGNCVSRQVRPTAQPVAEARLPHRVAGSHAQERAQLCGRFLWECVVPLVPADRGADRAFNAVPYEDQYHQLITIEWPGQNNTLAPYSPPFSASFLDFR